nr:recombinase family protein [Sphingomonas rubra]
MRIALWAIDHPASTSRKPARTRQAFRGQQQLQNARSIEDQVSLLRQRIEREGWEEVDLYTDYAISGAAGVGEAQRPGLHAMLARVEAGGIDQVLTESTDRIARHQGDAFQIRERLRFAGARLFTLLDGEVDEITGTIKGLMDARMREDLAARVRRGQRGVVAKGRSPSSVAYGYRRKPVLDEAGNLVRGLREIEPDEAVIVQRIFREFAAGRSARAIASALNEGGIPAPRARFWRATTLLGAPALGNGMLRNRLYVGEIVYGRTTGVQSPATRQTVVRASDEQVTVGAVPHLRIIDDALWEAAQQQLLAMSAMRPERARRPKHVLSGLGVCGVCGGPWIIVGDNGKARQRIWGCARAHEKACTNRRMITGHRYEARVLAELKGQMLAPDVVSAYVRTYHREHARETQALTRDRDRLERRLAEAERKRDRLVAAIAEGGSSFAEVRAALATARDDHERIRRELASMNALPVLTLHPGLADDYRRQIEGLEGLLADPEAHLEAIPQIRALIQRIELVPAKGKLRGVDLKVVRRIDEVMALTGFTQAASS